MSQASPPGPISEIFKRSDKVFWHGYIDFYERHFADRAFARIAEIGVLRGHSIRWLLDRFPGSEVHGADILPRQADWPADSRFSFTQLDQGDAPKLREFLSAGFDLVIEDGSHQPAHQALALVEGIRALRPGGLYILEDIHTSHPDYQRRWWQRKRPGNALSVLLALQHYMRIGVRIDAGKAAAIADHSIISAANVAMLADQIGSIELYRRTALPNSCFNCGSSDYAFSDYRCTCGADIYSPTDSMSFVIGKAA